MSQNLILGSQRYLESRKESIKESLKESIKDTIKENICVNCGNIVTENLDENLRKWFKDKWVNIGKKNKLRIINIIDKNGNLNKNVPNFYQNMDIKLGNHINIGWNSYDARALDPK